MTGVRSVAIADEFAINARPTSLCVFQLFEDDHARAFAHHKPIAVDVKGTRGVLWVVVARAHGFHGAETANSKLRDGGFAVAGKDDFCVPYLARSPRFASRLI